MSRVVLASLTVMVVLATACGQAPETRDGLTVVATTTVLGDVARNVIGTDGRVEVLTPVGVDPHDFQASAAQIAAINQADLVLANGLHLEEGLEDVLEAAAADGANVVFVAPALDPLPFSAGSGHEDSEEEPLDPHVWFDPLRMADAALLIAESLARVAPDVDWSARAGAYAGRLAEAHDDIAHILSSIPESRRRIVTNHDSLGYFADRYGFEVIGTVIPAGSTLADPSSQELASLIELMRTENVTVVFAESTQPELLAETVAAELGAEVRVVSLYTGSLDVEGTGADTLIGMLTTNAMRMAEALGG